MAPSNIAPEGGASRISFAHLIFFCASILADLALPRPTGHPTGLSGDASMENKLDREGLEKQGKVRFHCKGVPLELDEWERAANVFGPGY